MLPRPAAMHQPRLGHERRRPAPRLRAPAARRPASRLLAATVLALLALAGCGGPPPPEAAPRPVPGYLEPLGFPLDGLDLGPLDGRRILLDPGHGGFFRGAVGREGLTEAEVNLGVALHLRGLLEWAGAEVHMTRTANTDFLSPADSSLASDLAFRVSIMDTLQPDVFVSLHHNSNAALDRELNETQTYYPLADAGASRDLATAVHRRLALHLGIRPARLLPGNFHVLRNATVPAVLGEPAMLSHPAIEQRLGLAASQRLEAEAYFLGLLDHFAAGMPAWSGAPLDTVTADAGLAGAGLAWEFLPDGRRAAAGQAPPADPTSFTVLVDGRPAAAEVDAAGRTVTWRPRSPLPNHPVVVEVRGRNLAGRAAERRRTLVLPARATELRIRLVAADEATACTWETAGGRPLPDGTLVWPDGARTPVGPGLPAWQLRPDATPPAAFLPSAPADSVRLIISREALAAPWRWYALTPAGDTIPAAPPRWRARTLAGSGPAPAAAADPAAAAPLAALRPDQPAWLEAPGWRPLIDPAPGVTGPRTLDLAGLLPLHPEPVLPQLLGRVIVLDPAGGGGDDDGAGPLGTEGAAVNLETARQTAALLRGAGAEVHLTRTAEAAPSAVDKVRLAGDVGADLFLTIRRAGRDSGPAVRHHPGSAAGQAWAGHLAAALDSLVCGRDTTGVQPGWEYLLRHTACPALDAALPAPDSAEREVVVGSLAWSRAEARALLRAFAGFLADVEPPRTLWPHLVLDALPGGPPPSAVDYVVVDGGLLWTPTPDLPARRPLRNGSDAIALCRDAGLPVDGPRHVFEVHAAGAWQVWLLDAGAEPALLLQSP